MSDASPPPLAGVIGWPISHSRSPALHSHWLARYGIQGAYVPLGVKPQDFEEAIRTLPKLGFKGVNLTIPFKQAILPLADAISDRASLIGAANTITFRDDGTIFADNTDGVGFLSSVREAVPDWNAETGAALVLGAGGAARAIVSALVSAGVPEIRIANRTRQKADMLAEHFGGRVTASEWARLGEASQDVAMIVNTTALGMVGKPTLQVPLQSCAPGCLAIDIVYNPLETAFLADARAAGLVPVDGLGMLLHQAVPGFESWFGHKPEVDKALRAAVLGA